MITAELALDEELEELLASRWTLAPMASNGDAWGEPRVIAPPPTKSVVRWQAPYTTNVAVIRVARDGKLVADLPTRHVPVRRGDAVVVYYDLK